MKNKEKMPKKYFVIRKVNCWCSGQTTDIIGITTSETKAKKMQSVFCSYEEVKFVK